MLWGIIGLMTVKPICSVLNEDGEGEKGRGKSEKTSCVFWLRHSLLRGDRGIRSVQGKFAFLQGDSFFCSNGNVCLRRQIKMQMRENFPGSCS